MIHYGSQELAQSFRTVRKNTLEAARDIPEDKYDFRPSPDTRSVEKLLTHIALGYRFQHQLQVRAPAAFADGPRHREIAHARRLPNRVVAPPGTFPGGR